MKGGWGKGRRGRAPAKNGRAGARRAFAPAARCRSLVTDDHYTPEGVRCGSGRRNETGPVGPFERSFVMKKAKKSTKKKATKKSKKRK